MKKIRIGIAGYGIVGAKRLACILKHKDTDIVTICDRNKDLGKSLDKNIKFFKSYKNLLKEKLDAVFVCMPNDIAPKVTIEAISRGLNVFCEKPPGRSVEDILNVIDEHKLRSKNKLMYGFNHRYHESVLEAHKIIKSKKFGKVINLKGTYGKSKLITFNQPDWRTKRRIAGGGVLLDQGIHMLDLMRLFAGEFETVHSFVSNNFWNHDVEDNAYALMQTKKGVVGFIHSSATQWRHRFNLEINLERGSLILGGILSGTKSYGAETLTIIEADPDNDRGDPKEQIIRYNHDPSWDSEVSYFLDCIRKDSKIIKGSPDSALRTMLLVNKIYNNDPLWKAKFSIQDYEQ